ncbi:MAG TPA: nuclease-related domain-containing protein [Candidatus Limnocylindria bacterium]|nr:nuclease-related domain-containing protein [Candidatus Limnocylindria bacterium]
MGILGLASRDPLADGLARRLDDDWHWFRRPAPAGMEPIDAVVVGPGGTWALSNADASGRFTHRNRHWYRWNRSTESWVPWDPEPITRARLAARRLGLYLERAALQDGVRPLLVLPAAMSIEVGRDEPVGIVAERDPDRMAAIVTAEAVLSQQQVDRIVALLDPRQPLPQLAPSTPRG